MDAWHNYPETITGRTQMRKKSYYMQRLGVMTLGLLIMATAGCADRIVVPETASFERAGEIRTVRSFAALRVGIDNAALLDSISVGAEGAQKLYVSPVRNSQVLIIQPSGLPLGQAIKIRLFSKRDANVRDITLRLIEGALENGEILTTTVGTVVWLK